MKAEELRIGNWVYNSTTRNNMQVYPMMIPQLYNIEKEYGSLKDSNIKPISLSEEILVKCGFTKVTLDSNNPEEGHYYSLRLLDDKYCDISLVGGDKNGIFEVYLFPYENIRFQYLHQLQNLFHALTGKELEVKL